MERSVERAGDDEMSRPDGEAGDSKESEIYRTLSLAILTRRLTPGMKLSEEEVGETFGVSRTIARSAMRRLVHEGLLELRRNRGAFVACPSSAEAREIFEAWRSIEGAAVRYAAARATTSEIAELRRLNAQNMDAHRRGDAVASVRLSAQFHGRLADLSGNGVFSRFLRELVSRSSLIVAMYGDEHAPSCPVEGHAAVIDCLARGDADGAERAVIEHIAHVEDNVRLEERPQLRGNLLSLLHDVAATPADPAPKQAGRRSKAVDRKR